MANAATNSRGNGRGGMSLQTLEKAIIDLVSFVNWLRPADVNEVKKPIANEPRAGRFAAVIPDLLHGIAQLVDCQFSHTPRLAHFATEAKR